MVTFDRCGDCGSTIHPGCAWWPIPEEGVLCPSCGESWVRQAWWVRTEYELTSTLITVPRYRGPLLVSDHTT